MTSFVNPRTRSILSLAIPSIVVGAAAAILLIVVSLLANLLQKFLWTTLPPMFGATATTWWWTLTILTLTGVAVGLIVRFVSGHAGDDPATLELFGPPTPAWILPGIALTLIVGLAGGVSLGPENPILAIMIGLTVAIGSRAMPKVPTPAWMAVAAAGMIGAMFGTPVAAALLFSESLTGTKDKPLWDQLFAPLLAAGAGAVTMRFFEQPDFALNVPAYENPHLIDLLTGGVITLAACAVGLVAVWAFPLVHRAFISIRQPVLMLGLAGFVLGLLGIAGGPITMFKGLAEMKEVAANAGGYTALGLLSIVVIKLVAILISAGGGFRGGRIFPMVFVGVAFGYLAHTLVPWAPLPLALAASVMGFTLVATRDGWLSLFMAAVMIPGLALIPVLCLLLLAGWLLLAGQPLMVIEKDAPEAATPQSKHPGTPTHAGAAR